MKGTREVKALKEMEGRIEIPKIIYHGDDKKLKERVIKFKEGSFRIVVFTLMGLFMGFYSHTYVTDSFFPTKLVTAIPYKITEAMYLAILAGHTWVPAELRGWAVTTGNFFPYSVLADLLAEPGTTVLVGGAIYGAFAYFTGDKRVFTLQRFLKFAGAWCVLILLVVGAAFGINLKAGADNERFAGDPRFFFYNADGGGSGIYGDNEVTEMLKTSFYSELAPAELMRDIEGELPLGIYYDGETRYGIYRINYKKQYVVTEKGKIYHISEEFAQVAEDYAERNVQPGGEGAEVLEE